jgi:hypothetical protein
LDVEPESLAGYEIDHELSSRGYLDRQAGRFSMANIPRTRAIREVPPNTFQVIFGSVRRVRR